MREQAKYGAMRKDVDMLDVESEVESEVEEVKVAVKVKAGKKKAAGKKTKPIKK